MNSLKISANLACNLIYDQTKFKEFDQLFLIGETVCGIKRYGNTLYIANQGTIDLAGWQSDLEIETFDHPILGSLHSGFYKNIPELVNKILPYINMGTNIICCGHSKGAGEAVILSAILTLRGFHVLRNYLFACPNAAHREFASWIRKRIPGNSFRNDSPMIFLGDPVPLVPAYPYWAPYPHTLFTRYPSKLKVLLPSCWHSSDLYLAQFTQ